MITIIKPSFEILNINASLPLLELAGRTCYKSEERITDESSLDFIRGIIKRKHETILEHGTMMVRFIHNRGFTHELVRHRLACFSQESTRYVNYQNKGIQFINNYENSDACLGEWGVGRPFLESPDFIWFEAMSQAARLYNSLITGGRKPESARGVLPNDLKTEIVMTANLREWRHVFSLRALGTTGRPHPDMVRVMVPLLKETASRIPIIFDDLVGQLPKEE